MTNKNLNKFMYRMPGQDKPVKFTNDHNAKNSYDMLKHYIKDSITCASVGELDIWVDDEGLLKELPVNIIIKRSRGMEITARDTVLVGPAVFASHDAEGESIPPTAKAQSLLANMRPAGWSTKNNPDSMELVYIIEAFEN
jgi:hypothetical protein